MQSQIPTSSSSCPKSTKKRKKDAPKSLNGLLSLIAEQKPRPVTAPITTHETENVSGGNILIQLQAVEPIPVAIPPISSSLPSSSSVPVGQRPIAVTHAAVYPPAVTNAPYQSSHVGNSSSSSSSSSSNSTSSI